MYLAASRRNVFALAALLPMGATLLFAQTANQKQATKSAGNAAGVAPSSPIVLVGTIVEVRIPYGFYPEFGPGIRLSSGLTAVSSVKIEKDMMTASHSQIAATHSQMATELDMKMEKNTYTIKSSEYSLPSFTVVGGATIKVTGKMAGNTVYATQIDTVKKPEEIKYVPLRAIATPAQKKAMDAAQ